MDPEGPKRRLTHWEASSIEATGSWAQRRRLARAMRRVIEGLVTSDAPEAELARAADALERYADHLATHPRSRRYASWAETSPAGDTAAFFDSSPLIGLANPLAPPIELAADADGQRVHGRVVFGSAYEGPPGCVHGGFVAAAFDEVLGFANAHSHTPGMTARLEVNYRQPTPLHAPLRFEARFDGMEGRKIHTSGSLFAGERLTADARGLFVSVPPERFAALLEERARRERS